MGAAERHPVSGARVCCWDFDLERPLKPIRCHSRNLRQADNNATVLSSGAALPPLQPSAIIIYWYFLGCLPRSNNWRSRFRVRLAREQGGTQTGRKVKVACVRFAKAFVASDTRMGTSVLVYLLVITPSIPGCQHKIFLRCPGSVLPLLASLSRDTASKHGKVKSQSKDGPNRLLAECRTSQKLALPNCLRLCKQIVSPTQAQRHYTCTAN